MDLYDLLIDIAGEGWGNTFPPHPHYQDIILIERRRQIQIMIAPCQLP